MSRSQQRRGDRVHRPGSRMSPSMPRHPSTGRSIPAPPCAAPPREVRRGRRDVVRGGKANRTAEGARAFLYMSRGIRVPSGNRRVDGRLSPPKRNDAICPSSRHRDMEPSAMPRHKRRRAAPADGHHRVRGQDYWQVNDISRSPHQAALHLQPEPPPQPTPRCLNLGARPQRRRQRDGHGTTRWRRAPPRRSAHRPRRRRRIPGPPRHSRPFFSWPPPPSRTSP